MSNQTTIKMLESRVNMLNGALNQPTEYWDKSSARPCHNVGHYYVGQAYGAYRLEQIASGTGAARDISPSGTKREIWDYVTAMIAGVEAAQDTNG
jgi:hypothetical protein